LLIYVCRYNIILWLPPLKGISGELSSRFTLRIISGVEGWKDSCSTKILLSWLLRIISWEFFFAEISYSSEISEILSSRERLRTTISSINWMEDIMIMKFANELVRHYKWIKASFIYFDVIVPSIVPRSKGELINSTNPIGCTRTLIVLNLNLDWAYSYLTCMTSALIGWKVLPNCMLENLWALQINPAAHCSVF
jgi:hypothetical protein